MNTPQTEFKQVSKEEFEKFVKEYPNKLEWDRCGMSEPHFGTYNDFSNGKMWPESIVAKVDLYDGSAYHSFKQPEYFIMTQQS